MKNYLGISWLIKGLKGRSSWEWLQLLIIPAVLTLAGLYLSDQFERRQEKLEMEKYRRAELVNYLNTMTNLLIHQNLSLECGSEDYKDPACDKLSKVELKRAVAVFDVALALTKGIIKVLGGQGNAQVLAFLSDSGLSGIFHSERIFHGINLREANLSHLYLDGIDLTDANLIGADLTLTHLSKSILIGAQFQNATMEGAVLHCAWIFKANFTAAKKLDHVDFRGARLAGDGNCPDMVHLTYLEEEGDCSTIFPRYFDKNSQEICGLDDNYSSEICTACYEEFE
ncbi:pentapeptide repeat-containing protein [Microbulbifer variabilis]|uniref:pentapeptide repeat-containing protein n=1 Tax=Microbulbifer variabilis TaxID=266805 RepID=UPI00035F987C|nr:pentapeptide repeat-containing protein [Microbulbifer variabilis]